MRVIREADVETFLFAWLYSEYVVLNQPSWGEAVGP